MENIEWIEQHGKTAKGKRELLKYLRGERLTLRQAVYAMCYQCCGYFEDGKVDCEIDCPLYPFMPYRKDRQVVKRARSEKQTEHDRKLAVLRYGTNKTMSRSR